MIRFFKLSVLFLFYNLTVLAQVPKGINYQGVARLATGTPIAAKTISIKISLLQNSPTGTIEYSETHQPTTNEFGLFTLIIGQGTVSTGNFEFISWANGNKWLQIEMDPEGASNYSLIGTQQLMSVPYSYYAQYAGNSLKAGTGLSIENNIISNTGDNDNNASNELINNVTLGADKVLRITDAGGTKQADLSVLEGMVQNLSQVLSQGTDAGAQRISNLGAPSNSADAATKTYVDNHVDPDASPVNEIQDLNLTGNNLTITNNAVSTSINLAPYLDNTDNQNLTLSPVVGTSRTVNISNGTGVTFDVADNDNNATNEIQALTKTGGVISLSNGGGTVTLNDDSNTNELQTISKAGATISLTGGGSVTLSDDSNTNELQDLNRVGNILSLTGDATTVDLSSYLDNTDGQTLATLSVDANTRSIAIIGGNIINVDVRDADASITNEIQDLSINGITNLLSLSGDATTVNLTPYLDNTDNQNLSLTSPVVGTNRTINISNGTNVTFDVADNDNSATNEIQSLTKTGGLISLSNGGGTVTLNDDSNTNELQTISKAGATISLTGGGSVALNDDSNSNEIQNLTQVLTQGNDAAGNKILNLGAPTLTTDATTKQYVDNLDAADLDKSITNEIQNLSLAANTLSLTGDATTVNLAPYLDNTDSQNLSSSSSTTNRTINISGGIGTTIDVADNDNNSTNEIQTLSQVLTQGNSALGSKITSLGPPTVGTDATTKSYVDNAIATAVAANYAFKASYTFINTGGTFSDSPMNLVVNFDDFSVISSNKFTAPIAGAYMFTVTGNSLLGGVPIRLKITSGASILYDIKRQVAYPLVSIINYLDSNVYKLNPGDTVELVVTSSMTGERVDGILFGYKL